MCHFCFSIFFVLWNCQILTKLIIKDAWNSKGTFDANLVSFILQSMDQEEAQKQYMEILRSWPGYGSTLFDVEVSNAILSALMSRDIPQLFISSYIECRWPWGLMFGASLSDFLPCSWARHFTLIYKASELLRDKMIGCIVICDRQASCLGRVAFTLISTDAWLLWTYRREV